MMTKNNIISHGGGVRQRGDSRTSYLQNSKTIYKF